MDVPGIVQDELDGESVAANVSLGSEDALFVTPTRTLVYRSESLLSDESIETYPHDAERVTINEGRRKTRITLTYSIDGERDFAVPSSVTDDVLHPVLAGVLNGSGVTDPGETVVQTFRFSELTLIVTSDRLLKHVGSAVWDADHERYHFEDVTGLDFEEGSVATQIVLEVDGRPQRIKAPNEHVAVVRERLTQALCAYADVDSLEAFNALVDPQEEAPESSGSGVDFGEGVDPLGASSGDRPADTSGDPFLDDEKTESLDDGAPATQDADGGEGNPRRPVAGEDDASGGRRRAEPANEGGQRRAESSEGSATATDGTTEAASAGRSDPLSTNDGVGGVDDAGTVDDAGAVDDGGVAGDTGTADAGGAASTTDAAGSSVAGDDAADAAASTGDEGTGGESAGEFAAAGFEPATESGVTPADLATRIDDLEARVEAQNDLLERQQSLIQQLIEELRER